MRIRIIQNEDWLDGGCIVPWAKSNGHELVYTKLYKYEQVPAGIDTDALFLMGGPQNPGTTMEECPYYDTTKIKALIKKYVDAKNNLQILINKGLA